MAKSRHRKGHKKKVQQYKQKQREKSNVMNKMFQEQLAKIMEQRNSENGENAGETGQ